MKGEKSGGASRLYIITGLSGAGKSTALRVFEDLRYFAVDGLPSPVAPEVAAIMRREPMMRFPGMAMGLDVRQENFLADFEKSWDRLHKEGFNPRLIFLEADTPTLIRRYAQTRRPHPLECGRPGLEAAINSERDMLAPLRDRANLIIDSSQFSIHDLRRHILRHMGAESHARVNLLSFGFKYGAPAEADFVFDLRFLANPYFVESLRPLSGKNEEVADYIFAQPGTREFREKILSFLLFTLAAMEAEGRYRVTIALGCTGGRHRSVAMAEELGHALRQAGYAVALEHRDIERSVT